MFNSLTKLLLLKRKKWRWVELYFGKQLTYWFWVVAFSVIGCDILLNKCEKFHIFYLISSLCQWSLQTYFCNIMNKKLKTDLQARWAMLYCFAFGNFAHLFQKCNMIKNVGKKVEGKGVLSKSVAKRLWGGRWVRPPIFGRAPNFFDKNFNLVLKPWSSLTTLLVKRHKFSYKLVHISLKEEENSIKEVVKFLIWLRKTPVMSLVIGSQIILQPSS